MGEIVVDQCEGVELKRPVYGVWEKNPHRAPIPTRHEVWDHFLGIRVISTVEFTEPARGIELHLSISEYPGKYPSPASIRKVREDFEAYDFEQDDHGSTVAHLWLPVEKDKRGECPCEEKPHA